MAHIVLSWELGGGLGHLSRLQVLARELLAAGHQITLIARDLETARKIFSRLLKKFKDIRYVQAPFFNGHLPNSLEQTPAYVHVLFNVGYGHPDVLNRLVANWYQVLCELQPDMIIADHAPTALMVSRDMGIPRINFGDGFTCPAPEYPLPQLHKSLSIDTIKSDERRVVEYCNDALAVQGVSSINRLGDIYQTNETFLMTFAELDHLGQRAHVHYDGILESDKKDTEHLWPDIDGLKIFGYLKPQKHLIKQLYAIVRTGLSAVVYVPGITSQIRQEFGGHTNLVLTDQPVHSGDALKSAQLVISHGGHQLAAECMLAGIPQVHLALHLEQQLLSHRCQQTGCSLSTPPDQLEDALSRALEHFDFLAGRAQQQAEHLRNTSTANPLGRCIALIEYWLVA